MTITLSDGTILDPVLVSKVSLWYNPTRLQIDFKDANRMPHGVYSPNDPERDADLLETIRNEQHLPFLIFRAQKP